MNIIYKIKQLIEKKRENIKNWDGMIGIADDAEASYYEGKVTEVKSFIEELEEIVNGEKNG
ncbi:MAG: hypothetical protein AABY32_01145 [Nanoarchaeota archaeon]